MALLSFSRTRFRSRGFRYFSKAFPLLAVYLLYTNHFLSMVDSSYARWLILAAHQGF